MISIPDPKEQFGSSWPESFRRGGGDAVGAAILLADRQLITCAHVVNAALGQPGDSADEPDGSVVVEFPFSREERRISARVVRRATIGQDGGGDVAVLRLSQEPPQDCAPASLIHAERLTDHQFFVLGFPAGSPQGEVASGTLVGRIPGGWVQMEDIRQTGPRVRQGFSGAPVWDPRLRGIVGIVVTSSDQTPAGRMA